jgi:hypothetical protein
MYPPLRFAALRPGKKDEPRVSPRKRERERERERES